jgi:hypothetical protein
MSFEQYGDNWMRTVWSLLLLLGAVSCVTPAEKYSDYLDSLVGKKKRTLVKSFGVPDKVMELDDEDIYVYIELKGAVGAVNGFGYGIDYIQCKTQFTLKDDVVSDWEWDGHCP